MDIIDLGGAPAHEDCAQLGHTRNFAHINRLEVDVYRAAIIARHGMPPAGCSLVPVHNHHDFGSYLTLGLKVTPDARGRADVMEYVERVEPGLRSWIEAGYPAPVRYSGASPDTGTPPRLDDVIVSALLITRPDDSGEFPIPDFATLHGNLRSAYPEHARLAAERLGIANFTLEEAHHD